MDTVNTESKFGQFFEHWRPKVVASLNGQEVKLVKVEGVFPWHHHGGADEMFLVWRGQAAKFEHLECGIHGASTCRPSDDLLLQ